MNEHATSTSNAGMRRFLALMFVAGSLVLVAELLLSEHYEEQYQVLPVLLIVAGVVLSAMVAAISHRAPQAAFRAVMVLSAASGLFGTYLHVLAKSEFALERQPDLAGWTLFRASLEGSSPPVLAPLAMVGLALLGIAWSLQLSASRANTRGGFSRSTSHRDTP